VLRVLAALLFAAHADLLGDLGVAGEMSRILRRQCTQTVTHNQDLSRACRASSQRLVTVAQALNAMAYTKLGEFRAFARRVEKCLASKVRRVIMLYARPWTGLTIAQSIAIDIACTRSLRFTVFS
jgi:hypothetical protein